MTHQCGCCQGTESITPMAIANPPGLRQIQHRIGTHRTVFQSKIARLNQACSGDLEICESGGGSYPLRDRLKTRDISDPSIALLDAWATVADTLTFYQERIANEAYLATANQPRSLHELASLIGYRPRPGLSSSVLLAFTVEEPSTEPGMEATDSALPMGGVLIPKGTAAESTPAPGTNEESQTFETSEDFVGYVPWNDIALRTTRPQEISPAYLEILYLKGLGLGLIEGDYLYAVKESDVYVHRMVKIVEDSQREITIVYFPQSPLSKSTLITRINDILESFLSSIDSRTAPLLQTDSLQIVELLESHLRELLQVPSDARTLQQIDDQLCDEMTDWIQPGTASDPTIADQLDALTGWSQGLLDRLATTPRIQTQIDDFEDYKKKLRDVIDDEVLYPFSILVVPWDLHSEFTTLKDELASLPSLESHLDVATRIRDVIDEMRTRNRFRLDALTIINEVAEQFRLVNSDVKQSIRVMTNEVRLGTAPAVMSREGVYRDLVDAIDDLRSYIADTETGLFDALTKIRQFDSDILESAQEIDRRLLQTAGAMVVLREGIGDALRNMRLQFLREVRSVVEKDKTPISSETIVELNEQIELSKTTTDVTAESVRLSDLVSWVNAEIRANINQNSPLLYRLDDVIQVVAPGELAKPPTVTENQNLLNLLTQSPALSAEQLQEVMALLESELQAGVLDQINDLEIRLTQLKDRRLPGLILEALRNYRVDDPQLETKFYVLPTQANVFGWNSPPVDSELSVPKLDLAVEKATKNLPNGENVEQEVYYWTWWGGVQTVTVAADLPAVYVQEVKEKVKKNIRAFFNKLIHQPHDDYGEHSFKLYLDGEYRRIKPGDLIALRNREDAPPFGADPKHFEPTPRRVIDVGIRPRSVYDLSANATEIILDSPWWFPHDHRGEPIEGIFEELRRTRVFCEPQQLELAEQPYQQTNQQILVCDTLIPMLRPGQTLAVIGTPIAVSDQPTTGSASELVQIQDVKHRINLQLHGDRYVTHITLTEPLQNRFDQGTINANLVEATHGKSAEERIGDGFGPKAFLKLPLTDAPVSRLPHPEPLGSKDALKVYVNDVQWTQQPSFLDSEPHSQHFVSFDDHEQLTTVIFGDGKHGARPPSGFDNIQARYRFGLGRRGNVAADRIDQVSGSPIGVTGVVNPLPASGGADPDGPDQTRVRAPLSVMAFDRLVSVNDYRDFSLAFAGIGKAVSKRIGNKVYVTIAAEHAGRTPAESQLFQNLRLAIDRFRDRQQRFELHDRELSFLRLKAQIQLQPLHQWKVVKLHVREILLQHFSYQRADFGVDPRLADAISTIYSVPGVAQVAVNGFDSVQLQGSHQLDPPITLNQSISLKRGALAIDGFAPAELCFLSADVPDTLMIEQWINEA